MTGPDRAAFRAFVRTHHPDAGGDPAVFAAGLARFREPASRYDAPVTFVARRRGVAGLRRAATRAGRRRVTTSRPRHPRVAALLARFRRRPPRVR
ncbi:hypothetical protein [Amycolatopsis sp. CA-128772]|uniref:hypothetical protein n=1 Tax=Amycolatopsis sp. CA-128772 TaxID=2073159 RepID=UPI000CD0E0BB|nr:hypothetical protein [Amycolatopsis sp. CA-128772]